LPYRRVEGRLEVLLITSRDSRRWIIPKGWPERRVPVHVQAATEAMEEAGLIGTVTSEPVGKYRYLKKVDNGRLLRCDVDVFLLEVSEELDDWPERGERQKQWVTPAQAAMAVEEGGLAELILKIAARDLDVTSRVGATATLFPAHA
jgi:8-oxo-dGTP pyrophosphatase MutT (NUDIX family)